MNPSAIRPATAMKQPDDSGALDERRLRELIEVGRGLVAELDVETVFSRLLEVACELTGARYAALGVLDESRHELERFISHGIDEHTRQAIGHPPRGRGVLGLLIAEPRPLRLAEVGEHPHSYGFPPGHPPMSSFLGVPVVIRGHAWGNLYLAEKDGGEFDEADEQAAAILAEWAAIAVENARLYKSVEDRGAEMQRAIRRLEATTEIARAVGGETDLDRVLEIVVKRARALVEAGTLLIVLPEADELRVAALAGERGGGAEGRRVPLRRSVPGQVMEAGEPRRLRDLDPSLMARPGSEAAGVAALLVPLRFRGRSLGVLVALDPLGRAVFGDEDEQVLDSFAASAATALATAQSVAADRIRESIAATERERGRWARELHDESLQTLAGLRVLLSAARRGGRDTAGLLAQATEQVDGAIAELRRLIADLRPSALDELGLGAALEALTERMAAAGEIEVDLRVDPEFRTDRGPVRLVGEVEDTIYRLVQEALNNAVRHAQTGRAVVDVIEDGDSVRVTIVDEGRGFDPETRTDGFGLVGMRERVTLAGGSLAVSSARGYGTTISAALPARRRGDEAEGSSRHRAA
jgi:signal transduction histidine kinase